MCGRCGGSVYYAGSEGDIDWYCCSECYDVTAEHDPIFNHDISLHNNTSPSRRSRSRRKWFEN